MILPNIWQMMRDEKYYPDPERFDPERFVKKTVADDASDSGDESEGKFAGLREDDPSTLVFGFGRRYVLLSFVYVVHTSLHSYPRPRNVPSSLVITSSLCRLRVHILI